MRNSKTWLLFKIQLLSFFGINALKYSKDDAQKKKSKRTFYTVLLSLGAILYLSVQYSIMMSISFREIGRMDLLPAFMFMGATSITLILTTYRASTTLYGFKDFDLVASLPVKTSQIAASRVLVLYSASALYSLILLIPAAFVYQFTVHPPLQFWLFFAVTLPVVPLIPIIAAAMLGALVAFVSSFFKNTTLMHSALSIVLTLGVMALSMKSQNMMNAEFALAAQGVLGRILSFYPPAELYVKALCGGSIVSALVFIALSLLLFALFSWIIGFRLKSINSALTAKRTRSNYSMGRLGQSSPFKALLKKELKRFFGSTNYFMNMGIGVIMMIIVSVVAVVGGGSIGALLDDPANSGMIISALPFVLSSFICLSNPASCSISLEGKNLWQLKVLPVSAKTVLLAKAAMNVVVTLPAALLCATLLLIRFDFSPAEGLMLYLIPSSFSVLAAFGGVLINLKYPMLEWTSEVVPIKQSTASFIMSVCSMLPPIALAVLSAAAGEYSVFVMLGVFVVVSAFIFLEYRSMCTKSAEKFARL